MVIIKILSDYKLLILMYNLSSKFLFYYEDVDDLAFKIKEFFNS